MKYDDIASQADYHAATQQYVTEVYGEQVAQQFPGVADTVWCCILAGCPEAQTHLEVFIDYRVKPLPRANDQ